MRNNVSRRWVVGLWAVVSCLVGCSSGEPVSVRVDGIRWTNGLTVNGLTVNGLTVNGLTVNGLTVNGLATEEFRAWFAEHVEGRAELMSYLVRCALAEGEVLEHTHEETAVTYSWTGGLGLAPAWAAGHPATEAELQLVTACLGAHVNAVGEHVNVSMLGLDSQGAPLPYTDEEIDTYSLREAAFFGNVVSGAGFLVCNDGITVREAVAASRVCAVTGASRCAPMVHVGRCVETCTLDETGTFYVSCTHQGVSYRPITTRLRPAEVDRQVGAASVPVTANEGSSIDE